MQLFSFLMVTLETMSFVQSMRISNLRKILKDLEDNRPYFLYAFENGWSSAPPVYDYDSFSSVPVLYY